MVLIINAEISNPPTEIMPFRDLTMESKYTLRMDVLIEASQDLKDYYFYFLRPRGMIDFVEDFITPLERVDGIRIDTELNYPKTVVAQKITIFNYRDIFSKVQNISNSCSHI